MSLKIGPGIDSIPTDTIPNDPADFIAWFKGVGMKRWFANADTRNAKSGTGILITGNISTPATVSVSTELQALFVQPYVLVGSPVAPAVMTGYRSIAAQSGVVSLTDAGVKSSLTVGIVANGIGNTQLRKGAAASVIGNAASAIANVSDIAATANGQILWMAGGTLNFASPTANPTASVGLTAVAGTALTFMTSDSAPALSQAIAPTWTGNHAFAPAAGVAITVTAPSGQSPLTLNGTDIANAAINSSAAANRSVWRFQQAGAVVGFVGVDGSQVLLTGSTNGDLILRSAGNTIRLSCTGSTTQLAVAATNAVFGIPIGVNGNAAPAQVTGWGTPTSPSVVNNFSGTAATTAQMQAAIAKIITDLKALGLYAA